MKMLVGIDGSDASNRAVEWCAHHARPLDAEVIAVHAIDTPVMFTPGPGGLTLPEPVEIDRDQVRETAEHWCAPISASDTPFRLVVADGSASLAIMQTAATEDADLVVVGRHGRGGFAELVLGSTSYALIHHLGRPLVIIP